jgi:hypothetical protein
MVAIRGQVFLQAHPQVIPWLAATGLLANASDDLLMWWAALCGDPFAANEIHTAQYIASSDGQAAFGDIVAAGALLFPVVSSSFRVRTDVRICPFCGRRPDAPQWRWRNHVLKGRE